MKIDLPSFIPYSATCRAWHARHPKPMKSQWLTNERPIMDAQILHECSSAAIRCGRLCRDPCQTGLCLHVMNSFQPQLCSEICSTSVVETLVGTIHSQTLHTMLKKLWIGYTSRESQRRPKDRRHQNQTKIRNPGKPPTLRVSRLLVARRPWHQIAIPARPSIMFAVSHHRTPAVRNVLLLVTREGDEGRKIPFWA